MHPLTPACTQIPMLMIRRVSVTISGYRPIFEYFFRLKSSNSQDESATFPGHFLVHRLIAEGLNLQSHCHPMVGNLDRPCMRGNPLADNELAVGFPRPLGVYSINSLKMINNFLAVLNFDYTLTLIMSPFLTEHLGIVT